MAAENSTSMWDSRRNRMILVPLLFALIGAAYVGAYYWLVG